MNGSRRASDGGWGDRSTRTCQLRSILTATLLAFTLSACEWEDPFPDYRGVNLITNRGYSVDDFAEAYGNGDDPASTGDYITLSEPGAYGSLDGLPDDSAETIATIRSLEVVNLIPNGDFEAGVSPWITTGFTGGASPPSEFTVESAGVLIGSYVSFDVSANQGAAIDLDASMTIPIVDGGRYFAQALIQRSESRTDITFDYGDDATTSYNYLNSVSWRSIGPDDGSQPAPEALPDPTVDYRDLGMQFTVTETPNYFYLGSPRSALSQSGYLDNVRIGRLDNRPVLELPIPLETATGLPLPTGRYTFSVYVKSEVSSEVTPGRPNRFRAGQIAIGANGFRTLFTQEEYGWTDSTWVRLEQVVEVRPDDALEGRPLRLQLSVVDTARPAVGSILIARPELSLGSPE